MIPHQYFIFKTLFIWFKQFSKQTIFGVDSTIDELLIDYIFTFSTLLGVLVSINKILINLIAVDVTILTYGRNLSTDDESQRFFLSFIWHFLSTYSAL